MLTRSNSKTDEGGAWHQGRWALPSDMRAVVALLISLLLLTAVSASAWAQVPVVGWLGLSSPEQTAGAWDALRQGFRDLGHEEGRTLVIEPRNRPGGQTTGFTSLAPESLGKRLQLLKEMLPNLSRVAVLHHSGDDWDHHWQEMDRVAPQLGLSVSKAPVARPEDIEGAIAAAVRQHAGALIVFPGAITWGARERIAALAVKHRLPTGFDHRGSVVAGGLFSYGPDVGDFCRRIAPGHVDKILNGAAPGGLPVQQPIRFEFAVNLRTARAIGVSVPTSLLARANEVLE